MREHRENAITGRQQPFDTYYGPRMHAESIFMSARVFIGVILQCSRHVTDR